MFHHYLIVFYPCWLSIYIVFYQFTKEWNLMMFVGNKETYFECQKSCIMSDIQDGFFCKNNVLKVLIKPLHWPFINCFRSLHLRCFTEQFLLLCLCKHIYLKYWVLMKKIKIYTTLINQKFCAQAARARPRVGRYLVLGRYSTVLKCVYHICRVVHSHLL